MSDDNMGARKRKNGEDDFDLNLCLSPPAQRPRQAQLSPPPGVIPSLSLSPQDFWTEFQHQAPVPGEAALGREAFPFPPGPYTAPVGPSHHASAFLAPAASVAANGPQQFFYRFVCPRPTLSPAPVAAAHFAGGSSVPLSPSPPPPPPPPPPPSLPPPPPDAVAIPQGRPARSRRNPSQAPRGGKDNIIEPPFPWATNRRAVVHSKSDLLSSGIRTISGEVQCKRCEYKGTMEFDLEEKYIEVRSFIAANKHRLHDRAPPQWTSPVFPACPECKQLNCLKPVVAPKKRAINWLFLLLGQTLGCCTLEQLKYFCKHTENHRTGAKDRVLYLTFLGVCKQLENLDMFKPNS